MVFLSNLMMEGILEKENGFGQPLRDLWKNSKTGVALLFGSTFFLIYSFFAVKYEIGNGWSGYPSVQNVLDDISKFIPVAAAVVTTLIGGIDLVVFLSSWYGDWRKKRFQEAVEAAIQKARDEGYQEGYAAGQQDKDSEDDETD